MEPDDEIRALVVKKESAEVIKRHAVQKGMRTLKQDGFLKVGKGLTSIDEVLRVTHEA